MELEPKQAPAHTGRPRLHAMRLILIRDSRAMLLGPGTIVITLLGALAAYLFLSNYRYAVGESGLMILSGAFNFPVYAILFTLAFYLALASVTSVARECEQGTLETLFYGPIDSIAYIAGKLAAYAITYIAALGLCAIGYLIHIQISRFAFPAATWAVIGLSLPITLHLVAFGICLSALSRRVRTSTGWFLVIVLLFLALQFSPDLLALAPTTSRFHHPMRLTREILEQMNLFFTWLSPFALLTKGTEAVRRGDMGQYLEALAIALAFTVLFTGAGMAVLLRRGIRS